MKAEESKTKPEIGKFFLYIVGAVSVFAVFVYFFFSKPAEEASTESTSEETPPSDIAMGKYESPPEMIIDPERNYTATLSTSKGEITMELFADEAPVTVNNFVFLAQEGFYDNTKFHRIIENFMIQGGDPNGDGTGGPGYTFADEEINRDYQRGIAAMANRGPDTNGSQFFIMHQNQDLPKNYVIFGQVIEGMEVVDEIASSETEDNGLGEKSKPIEDIVVETIKIDTT